jgi:hypothetical protein
MATVARTGGRPVALARRAVAEVRGDVAVAWRALWVSRLVVWVAGTAAIGVWGVSDRAPDFDPAGVTTPFGDPWDALLGPAARWDTTWFLAVADGGYEDGPVAAFFPLFPLLAKVVGLALGGQTLLGGLLVAWSGALCGLACVHRLALLELRDARAARLTVWAVALFPTSLFLTAVYSEGLFLAVSAGALLAARTDRWALAGALGAMAAATRSAGIVLVVPLALLWWDARRSRARRDPALLDLGLALAPVPLGLLAFCAFLALTGTDPGAPFRAQEVWFREFAGPFAGAWDGLVAGWDGARQLLSGAREPVFFEQAGGDPFAVAGQNLKDLAALLFAAPLVVLALRRLPLAHGAYAIAALALPLSYPVGPQPLMSLPRFVLVLVPLFLALGAWLAAGPRWRVRAAAAVAVPLLALFSAQFATWRFVA